MDTLIVCSNKEKERYLEELNNKPLTNISFMNMRDFIHNYYFDYTKETIYYLVNKYHYKYDIALEYLDNLYYILDKKYNNYKLDHLVSLKKELDDKGLLVYNPLFKSYLSNRKVVFGAYLNKFELYMIESLKDICSVEIRDIDNNNYHPTVYSFKTIGDEVEYVAYQICKLIDKGIDPNRIKLANVNDDYRQVIKRIFKLYNLTIQDEDSLFGMNIVHDFIKYYDTDLNKTVELLKDKYDLKIINKLIDIINRYNFADDYLKVKDLIIEDIKKVKIKTNYNNQIELIDYHDDYRDDYVFLMSFNEENIPKKYQDIDYINDDIKPIYMDNTIDKNRLEKQIIKDFISNTKNLVITYKSHTPFSHFYPSSLIEELNLEVKEGMIDKQISYSYDMGLLKTCMMYDNYYKYGVKDKDLSLFNTNYSINYHNYSNKFKGIEMDNEPFTLSYTSMDTYYKCRFRYYLNRILKIDKDNNNLSKYIGSIFHYVLEKCLYSDLDYKVAIKEYLNNNDIVLSFKERFFLDKLTVELPNIIQELKKQEAYIKLKNHLTEEKVVIDFGDSKFMGVIDKVLYDDDMYAIIDYKTGNTDINISNIKYGLGMQLPVYLYLAHKKFSGHIVGFYLNQIIHSNIKYDLKKSYDKIYQENLKLYGYSNSNYIDKFDSSYKDSEIIKSLKVKNDGDFYSYSKVLSNDQIEDMIEQVEDKILECIDDIKSGKFDINPKNINGKNISCEYCPYSDICFKTNEDIVYLKEEENA